MKYNFDDETVNIRINKCLNAKLHQNIKSCSSQINSDHIITSSKNIILNNNKIIFRTKRRHPTSNKYNSFCGEEPISNHNHNHNHRVRLVMVICLKKIL